MIYERKSTKDNYFSLVNIIICSRETISNFWTHAFHRIVTRKLCGSNLKFLTPLRETYKKKNGFSLHKSFLFFFWPPHTRRDIIVIDVDKSSTRHFLVFGDFRCFYLCGNFPSHLFHRCVTIICISSFSLSPSSSSLQ